MKQQTVKAMLEKLPSGPKEQKRYQRLVKATTEPNNTVDELLKKRLKECKRCGTRVYVDKALVELVKQFHVRSERVAKNSKLISAAQSNLKEMMSSPQFANYMSTILLNFAHNQCLDSSNQKIALKFILVIFIDLETDALPKVLTITNTRDVYNLRVEIQDVACYGEGSLMNFKPCKAYSGILINQALVALSKPKSTIDFLIGKFGDGRMKKRA